MKNIFKSIVFIIVGVSIVAGLVCLFFRLDFYNFIHHKTSHQDRQANYQHQKQATVFIGNRELTVKVAASPTERYRGLSGQKNLTDKQGMLFIHSQPAYHRYVMRGMLIPLDFIFIRGKKIVDLKTEIPADYSGDIQGKIPYDLILELPAGWVKRNRVKIGETVEIIKKSDRK